MLNCAFKTGNGPEKLLNDNPPNVLREISVPVFSGFKRFSTRVPSTVSLATLIFVSGCGYAEYETRLNESKKYYAYLDRIEQSLAPKWLVAGNLMELRVPRQFSLIPAPLPTQKDDGTIEAPAVDPRQPDYLNLILPGLFGAWEAPFKVMKPNGTAEDRKGYIYVLSNYWELAGERPADAGAFVENLKNLLSENLRIQPSDERTEVHPKVMPAYQAQLQYDACAFKGKPIDGVNYTFETYSRTNGSVIATLVLVLPEGMDSPQKVSERIPMMLESFSFTKNPPKAGADKNGPAQPNPGKVGF